jgi:hypothetical protein
MLLHHRMIVSGLYTTKTICINKILAHLPLFARLKLHPAYSNPLARQQIPPFALISIYNLQCILVAGQKVWGNGDPGPGV